MQPAHPVRHEPFRHASQLPDLQAGDYRATGAGVCGCATAATWPFVAGAARSVNKARHRGPFRWKTTSRRAGRATNPGEVAHIAECSGHYGGDCCVCSLGRWRLAFLFEAQGESGSGEGKSRRAGSYAICHAKRRSAGCFDEDASGLHQFDELQRGRNRHRVR